MTTEQKLAAIIKAQVKGGCNKWEEMDVDTRLVPNGCIETTTPDGSMIGHVLEILLDPAGLRAAYGDGVVCEGCLNRVAAKCHCELYGGGTPDITAMHIIAARTLLDAWLSSDGDTVTTISTAYDLLPKA